MNNLRQALLSTFVAVSTFSVSAFGADPVTLPEPTGTFAVGRTLHYIDTDRDEPWTELADDKRELPLLIWYPAGVGTGTSIDYLPYGSDADSDRFDVVREWSSNLTAHSLQDAPIASTPGTFPIIIFSPGAGTGPWGYHMLLEDLASHGFIVVGIDHAYHGAGQILRDGTFIQPASGMRFDPKSEQGSEEFTEEVKRWFMGRADVRTDDFRSVVEALHILNAKTDSYLRNRLDLERIGALGHSIGGIAAAHALAEVEGIQSGINIDGHFDSMTFDPARVPSNPFMAIEAHGPMLGDEVLEAEGLTREEYDRLMRSFSNRQAASYRQIEQGAYRVTIDGANHSTVHDRVLIRVQEPDYADGEPIEIVQAARIYLHAFFQKTLLGMTSTALDIMPEELYSYTSVEEFRIPDSH